MKFEIKVETRGEFQKSLLLGHLHRIFGLTISDARKIVDEIEKLHEIGGSRASVIIDSEGITMSPIFKTEKPNPVFTYKDLRLEVNVIKEVEDRLDLCQLLKNSIGKKFYMPHFGEVTLNSIAESYKAMKFEDSKSNQHIVLYNGYSSTGEEVCVFPSKDQRDWSLFVPPWIPKEGERVWVWHRNISESWVAAYFAEYVPNAEFKYFTYIEQQKAGPITNWDKCVPFNEIPW